MDIAANRKQTNLRLPVDLYEAVKSLAASEHRSFNNFIESVLAERVKAQYRKETLQAVEEIKDGKTFGPVDTTSIESMLKSMGL